MAWRPNDYIVEGELDNTTPGRVTGWLRFVGLEKTVTLSLEGNFHRDIRGARVYVHAAAVTDGPEAAATCLASRCVRRERSET